MRRAKSIQAVLAHNLARFQHQHGWSSEELAARSEIPHETLEQILRGEIAAEVGTLERLATVLQVTEVQLVERKRPRQETAMPRKGPDARRRRKRAKQKP